MKGEGWVSERRLQKAFVEGSWHQKLKCFMQGPALSVLGPPLSPGVLGTAVTSQAEKGRGKPSSAARFAAAAERLQVKLPCRKEGFMVREVKLDQVAEGT